MVKRRSKNRYLSIKICFWIWHSIANPKSGFQDLNLDFPIERTLSMLSAWFGSLFKNHTVLHQVCTIDTNWTLTIKFFAWYRKTQISSKVLAIISNFSVSKAWSRSAVTIPDVAMVTSPSGDNVPAVSLGSVPSPTESDSTSGGLELDVVSTILDTKKE